MARLCVIAVSDAFRGFWHVLSEDLAVVIDVLSPSDPVAFKPDTVALILAAGGAERDAVKWLENHRVPAGVAALVVGTDTGRRIAMKLVARGASDYFALPDDLEIFRNAVGAAMSGVPRGGQAPTDAAHAFAGIVGESQAIKQALTRAARLLPHGNARALIIGETGTGKEVLARAIHAGGPRRAAPFVAVNCSAFPENLIESELFGHERGSFTDAHAAKPGLFEMADTGTLFLDEIGDLPLSLQAKLLRLLEDKEIRRVGGTKPRTVDVRILAATNAHLSDRVREKSFREDLFFRLSTVTLKLPPLRERGDDIILIAQAVLKRLAGEHHLPVPTLTPEVCERLRRHAWPGNVRELKNAVERGLLLSPPGELNVDELLPPVDAEAQGDTLIPFPAPLDQITSAAARATVRLCGGNRSESARRLSISTRRLRRLLNGGRDVEDETEADDLVEPTALSM